MGNGMIKRRGTSGQEKISDILARRIAHLGLGRQVGAARICAVAREISGGEFEPVSFRGGTLKVRASSSAKAHLIKLKERETLRQINSRLGRELVKKIVFEVL